MVEMHHKSVVNDNGFTSGIEASTINVNGNTVIIEHNVPFKIKIFKNFRYMLV